MVASPPQPGPRRPDLLTVTMIALVAYAASNVVHEALGHGGACVVLGGHPLVLSSVHFDCGDGTMGSFGRRGVAAAGTVANFVAGGLALLAFTRTHPRQKPHAAYFLWLFATLNLLMGAGYFLFSGVGNIGDWADVARGTMSPLVWRPVMAVGGGALYFLLARQSARWLGALVGRDAWSRARARALTVPAYLAGGVLFCVAGSFNPVGPLLIAISAAASSFGGASGLLWLTQFLGKDRPDESAVLDRRVTWILAGGVAAVIFVAILGPSVHF